MNINRTLLVGEVLGVVDDMIESNKKLGSVVYINLRLGLHVVDALVEVEEGLCVVIADREDMGLRGDEPITSKLFHKAINRVDGRESIFVSSDAYKLDGAWEIYDVWMLENCILLNCVENWTMNN